MKLQKRLFQQNSAQRIEELLLEQVQLITVGQTYPIWIAQNLYIYFTVGKTKALCFLPLPFVFLFIYFALFFLLDHANKL